MAVVADSWARLPVLDAALDRVLVVFAPRNGPEIARVLRPGGLLVVVTPAADHLAELVGPLGLLRVDPRKAERTATTWGRPCAPSTRRTGRRCLDRGGGGGPGRHGAARPTPGPQRSRPALEAFPAEVPVTVAVEIGVYEPSRGRLAARLPGGAEPVRSRPSKLSDRDDCTGAHRESAEPGPRCSQGFALVERAANHRPQNHRSDVPGDIVHHVHGSVA